jgi:hypothetical protein
MIARLAVCTFAWRRRRTHYVIARLTVATGARRRSALATSVSGVCPPDAMVAVTFVAGVVVGPIGHLPWRVLVVGLADTTCTRLASGLAATIAVSAGRTVTRRAIRATWALAIGAAAVLVRITDRLRLAGIATGAGIALAVIRLA